MVIQGPAAKGVVVEKASSLFVEEDLVLVVLDPPRALLNEIATTLNVLKERAGVIIYSTLPELDLPPSLDAVRITVEKEKEKRIKDKVLAAVRADGKKMTDKAYALLKERIRDEALLAQELAKLINYVGDKKLIEVKDVAAIVTEVREEDFIRLSEAMARKDKKQIIAILETLLSQGLSLLAVHGFMTRHTGLLLQARDAEEFFKGAPEFRLFSKGFGRLREDLDPAPVEKRNYLAFQKPFYAYNLCKTSQKFSEETLLAFIEMLARFDRRIKKGTRHDRTNFEAELLEV